MNNPPKVRYPGKYKGYVRANNDPENRGRIRCYCPQVMGAGLDDPNHWLDWAELCAPWLGGVNTTDFGSPLTKDQNGGKDLFGVWIEFEGAGNPDFPIWVGTFTVAATPMDPNAQLDLTNAAGMSGGDILSNPPAGSTVATPSPLPDDQELRFMVKEGHDIVIGAKNGGYVILGPNGVQFYGVNIYANGRMISAALADKVTG